MVEPIVGEFYLFKNGTLGRVIHINSNPTKDSYGDVRPNIKLRCMRPCIGQYSNKQRIGKPYSYQQLSKPSRFINAKRIGTEEILDAIFNTK